jgi:phosphatidylinositol glycan class V
MFADEKHHARLVVSLSLTARILTSLLVYLGAVASIPFDSSHFALEPINATSLSPTWASSVLRWDAFHFTHIAQNGYVYEYQYAFMPGTPATMRLAAFIVRTLVRWERLPSQCELLVCGFIVSILLDPAWSLYQFVPSVG